VEVVGEQQGNSSDSLQGGLVFRALPASLSALRHGSLHPGTDRVDLC